MQKFGIEIRKSGDLTNLYRDVDQVLKKVQTSDGAVMDQMKIHTVAHSLQKMLGVESHFCVTTVRKCSDICQVCIPKERMDIYQAMHCHDWNTMTPEYRQMLVAMVLADFRVVLCGN